MRPFSPMLKTIVFVTFVAILMPIVVVVGVSSWRGGLVVLAWAGCGTDMGDTNAM